MAIKDACTANCKERRRRRALELQQAGWTQQEIAAALGVTKGAVSQWMSAVREHGEAGLQALPHKGATLKLTPAQMELIPDLLSHGAQAHGFRGEVWTCARVVLVIRQEFGVIYHKGHVTRLLRALQWTPQKPRTRATQRNEVEIELWRTEVWPELKKRRSGSDALWSSWMRPAFTCCLEW